MDKFEKGDNFYECECSEYLDLNFARETIDHLCKCPKYFENRKKVISKISTVLQQISNKQELHLFSLFVGNMINQRSQQLAVSTQGKQVNSIPTTPAIKSTTDRAPAISSREVPSKPVPIPGSFYKKPVIAKPGNIKKPVNITMGVKSKESGPKEDSSDFDFGDEDDERGKILPKPGIKIQTNKPPTKEKEKLYLKAELSFGCCVCKSETNFDRLIQGNCDHLICTECVKLYLLKKIRIERRTQCIFIDCNTIWEAGNLLPLLEHRKDCFEEIKALRELFTLKNPIDNVVTCKACKSAVILEPGDLNSSPDKDASGELMSKVYRKMYAVDRFKCPSCGLEQCKVCRASPYHLGLNCYEYTHLTPCRYCLTPLEHEIDYKIHPLVDLCTENPNCHDLAKPACTSLLKCGHRCYGIKNEKSHPLCLDLRCAGPEISKDICVFCNECLSRSPVVTLGCGHFLHFHCLAENFKKKWCTKRITFGFLNCPSCKAMISLPGECALNKELAMLKGLFQKVTAMSVAKLAVDKKEGDPQLTAKTSRFFNKKEAYALAIYAFYECGKCKEPFVGGQVSCEMEANIEPDPNNRESYICLKCSDTKVCTIHGPDGMVFKCKFCCQYASWFCWGSTHFCNDCHSKQTKDKQYAKVGPFPKCNASLCPLKGRHPATPHEHCFGCTLCGK